MTRKRVSLIILALGVLATFTFCFRSEILHVVLILSRPVEKIEFAGASTAVRQPLFVFPNSPDGRIFIGLSKRFHWGYHQEASIVLDPKFDEALLRDIRRYCGLEANRCENWMIRALGSRWIAYAFIAPRAISDSGTTYSVRMFSASHDAVVSYNGPKELYPKFSKLFADEN